MAALRPNEVSGEFHVRPSMSVLLAENSSATRSARWVRVANAQVAGIVPKKTVAILSSYQTLQMVDGCFSCFRLLMDHMTGLLNGGGGHSASSTRGGRTRPSCHMLLVKLLRMLQILM